MLRATACNFSSLIWPAGSAPAALASLLFDPPEPQVIGKIVFRHFPTFRAPGSSFFWDFLFCDLLFPSLRSSDSSHLCFSSVHIVGSLTFKLPSIILEAYFNEILAEVSRGAATHIIEGSLEVKLPTIWRDEKAVSREKSQKRKDQKKEDAGARKGRKVAKHCVFSWFCGSGGLKSRLAKAAGAETSGEMRDEKLHAVVARSTFGSKMC